MGNKCRFYVDIMALHREVTGSCLINVVKFPDGSTKKFLVDCGLFQEPKYTDLNKTLPFKAEDINYVVVTHNHIDHIGRLPLLVKNGFHGRIITSRDTSILLRHALNDSYKILNQKAKLLNESVLYSEEDVQKTLALVEGYPFEESIWLDENIKVTLFMNGHLQGAGHGDRQESDRVSDHCQHMRRLYGRVHSLSSRRVLCRPLFPSRASGAYLHLYSGDCRGSLPLSVGGSRRHLCQIF